MFLDYLIVPLLCTIYGASTVQRLVPGVPYAVLALLFAGGMTALNLRGIRSTTRANFVMLVVMCALVGVFIVLALRQLYVGAGWGGVLSIKPFYDPATFRWQSILGGTSLAALTYIGFDGVTTLAEEVENPRRNVLLATVLVCLITGLFGGLQVYLGQRIWPDYHTFPSLETAYMDINRKIGGAALFHAMAFVLVLANFGSGLGGQVGAARLLFGMGRDQVLPARPFAYVSPSNSNPTYNILLIGAVAFAGALVFDYEQAAETLNFGAFLAFMGVNLAALRQFYFRRPAGQRRIWETVLPAAGFLFCLMIWLGLRTPAKVVGGCWLLAGILYSAIQTRGFRLPPPAIRFDPEQDV